MLSGALESPDLLLSQSIAYSHNSNIHPSTSLNPLGTTFLHELLGLHPKVRMHYTWEQVEHVPHTHTETVAAMQSDRLTRFRGLRHKFDLMLRLMGDAIQSIHRIGCVLILSNEF